MIDVVVTGMGVVAPTGTGRAAVWRAALEGRSGIVAVTDPDLTGMPCVPVAGLVPPAERRRLEAEHGGAHPDPSAWWARDVLLQAWADAGLDGAAPARPVGFVAAPVWPGRGGAPADRWLRSWRRRGGDRFGAGGLAVGECGEAVGVSALDVDAVDLGAVAADALGIPVMPSRVEATCAGGLRAVAEAARSIVVGDADVAVALAVVSRQNPYMISQFAQLGALSTWRGEPAQACRPFDVDRCGMVMAEAASAVVLERADHARARGARPWARLAGWGTAHDTAHPTAPGPAAVEAAMRRACDHAGIPAAAVGTVNTHGTSTRLNDVSEAAALQALWGSRAVEVPAAAVKAGTGHASSASGILELGVLALTLREGVVPPTPTCERPDPECPVGVATTARPVADTWGMTTSFGFGGQYAAMVMEAW